MLSGTTISSFEQHYISLRRKEGRLYQDEQVRRLPGINADHPLRHEWALRAESAGRLAGYLSVRKPGSAILEVGCGNGWLANFLLSVPGSTVTGIDINTVELEQAKRVFQNERLQFACGSPEDFRDSLFDVIVFAASLQYFPSAPLVLQAALEMLKPGGEIHITDTAFYSVVGSITARQRSENYFRAAGEPGMCDFYFHHSLRDLGSFRYTIL
ncbi:MAG TPA: class I SAM-dependent methyltransferase, partial [Flavisolibacter sp.]